MMKKLIKSGISILLCAVMIFGSAPLEGLKDINLSGAFKKIAGWFDSIQLSLPASALASSGQCGSNVYWEFDEETGTLTISGEGNMYNFSSASSPFYNNADITSVVIEEGVTSIGSYAFENCKGITSIEIPDGVTSISNYAFHSCKGITSIIIPDGVTIIGNYAFENCKGITSIVIPDSVTSICSYAFQDCEGLTSISLPNGLTYIGEWAFNGCNGITSITIPGSVATIGNYAFYSLKDLTSVAIGNNAAIGSNATSIGKAAFGYCSNIRSITIGNSVKSIGQSAFGNCTGLTDVTIPKSVTNIYGSAFAGCELSSISVDSDNTKYNDADGSNVIVETATGKLIFGINNSVIPDNITAIGDYAFYNCSSLKKITIPDSVTSIGIHAFRNCTGLTSVTIPNSVISIGIHAFCNCTGLTSVTIPDSVTSIGDYAFLECSGLRNITIGNGLKNIGDYSFYGCSSLISITIPKSVTSIGNYVFDECFNLTIRYAGSELQWAGIDIGSDNDKLFNATIVFLDFRESDTECGDDLHWEFDEETGTLTISGEGDMYNFMPGASPFYNNKAIKEVIINEGVTKIGANDFEGCSSLEIIIIADSITKLESNPFTGCRLKYVDMGDGLTSIPPSLVKANMTSLETFIIGSGVISVPDEMFKDCSELKRVKIPISVERIGEKAFWGCTSLIDVSIPSKAKNIGKGAFYNVANITFGSLNLDFFASLTAKRNYPWGARTINGYVEDGLVYSDTSMSQLTACQSCVTGDVEIPDSVTSIKVGRYGTNVNYPSLNRPDIYVFNNCSKITSIIIPSSVHNIAEFAFLGVNNIIYSENWYNDVMHGNGSPWGAKAVEAYIEDGLYYYDSSKELLLGCSPEKSGAVSIPDSVEEVGENCFNGCENVTSISFSSPVFFADTAVAGCKNLQSVTAPSNSDGFGVVYTKPVSDGGFSLDSVSDSNISIEYDTGILFCDRTASGTYTVPQEITRICENAFANCKNVSVNIPSSVNLKRIGENAFLNSADYNDLSKWADNVLIIGNYIVASKSMLSGIISLADSIRGIADSAFKGCSGMTGFKCGGGLRFLGSRAFSGCSTELKNNITLSEGLSYVGKDLFDVSSDTDESRETEYYNNVLVSVSPDVEALEIKEGTTVIAEGAFSGCTNLRSITVPDSVTRIDKNTFKGCMNLQSVTLNSNITEIGDNAFADCISLTEITIPAGVNEIGHLAFYGCTGMESFNVAGGNTKYKSVDGILTSADGKTIIQYPAMKDGTDYTISDNMFISDLAFYRCRKLEKITLGDDIEYGNRNPFASCTAGFNYDEEDTDILFGDTDCTVLKSVSASVSGVFTIPDTVSEIGIDAFRDCTGITEIDFSKAEDIDKIGDYSFYGCTGLKSIAIPNTVTVIGNSAFKNCLNLQSVEFKNNVPAGNYTLISIGDFAFCNCRCNTKDGSCNYDNLKAENIKIGKNAFRNVFRDSVKIESSGLIYGFAPGLESLKDFIGIDDGSVNISSGTKTIGTGSVITVTTADEESSYYNAVIFGDVNGDGRYDGTDSVIVNCLANGLLSKDKVGEAVYTAADCNHDGVIDEKDVALLEQAGVILTDVDQTKR